MAWFPLVCLVSFTLSQKHCPPATLPAQRLRQGGGGGAFTPDPGGVVATVSRNIWRDRGAARLLLAVALARRMSAIGALFFAFCAKTWSRRSRGERAQCGQRPGWARSVLVVRGLRVGFFRMLGHLGKSFAKVATLPWPPTLRVRASPLVAGRGEQDATRAWRSPGRTAKIPYRRFSGVISPTGVVAVFGRSWSVGGRAAVSKKRRSQIGPRCFFVSALVLYVFLGAGSGAGAEPPSRAPRDEAAAATRRAKTVSRQIPLLGGRRSTTAYSRRCEAQRSPVI